MKFYTNVHPYTGDHHGCLCEVCAGLEAAASPFLAILENPTHDAVCGGCGKAVWEILMDEDDTAEQSVAINKPMNDLIASIVNGSYKSARVLHRICEQNKDEVLT